VRVYPGNGQALWAGPMFPDALTDWEIISRACANLPPLAAIRWTNAWVLSAGFTQLFLVLVAWATDGGPTLPLPWPCLEDKLCGTARGEEQAGVGGRTLAWGSLCLIYTLAQRRDWDLLAGAVVMCPPMHNDTCIWSGSPEPWPSFAQCLRDTAIKYTQQEGTCRGSELGRAAKDAPYYRIRLLLLLTLSSPQLQVGNWPRCCSTWRREDPLPATFATAPWKMQDVGTFACRQWMLLQWKALSASSPFSDTDRWRDDPSTCGPVFWEKSSEVRGPRLETRCPAGDSVALPLLMHWSITCPV